MNTETKVMMSAAAQEYNKADLPPSEVSATNVKDYFQECARYEPPTPDLLLAWTIVRTPALCERVDWEYVSREARSVLQYEPDHTPTLTSRVLHYLEKPGVNRTMRGIVEGLRERDDKPKDIKETVNTLVRLNLVESHSEGSAMWFSVRPV